MPALLDNPPMSPTSHVSPDKTNPNILLANNSGDEDNFLYLFLISPVFTYRPNIGRTSISRPISGYFQHGHLPENRTSTQGG
jgi:hypothetical protein